MGKTAEKSQINVRVEPSTMDVFEAAIYARRLRGPQELLGPILEELASKLAADAGVQTAIRARQEADAQASGKLKPMRRTQQNTHDAS